VSTLNYLQTTDETGMIFVDTLDSTGREVAKMTVVEHLGAIVAGRGRPLALACAVGAFKACPSFDVAFNVAQVVFHEARAAADEWETLNAPQHLKDERTRIHSLYAMGSEGGDELLLAGWSHSKQAIRAVQLRSPQGGAVDVLEDAGVIVGPPHPSVIAAFESGLVPDDEGALASVRLQHALLREQYPAAAAEGLPGYGGRLLMGRIARPGITLRDLGVL
jgi:hypothetical protein